MKVIWKIAIMTDFFQKLTVHFAINIYFGMLRKISVKAPEVCLRVDYYSYYHKLKSHDHRVSVFGHLLKNLEYLKTNTMEERQTKKCSYYVAFYRSLFMI